MQASFLHVCFLCACLALSACASSMKRHYESLNKKIISGNFEEAAKFVEESKSKYGDKNNLLYYLDGGLTRHLAADYALSNTNFETAKTIYDDYYTKSITSALRSYASSDLSKPYYGQDYDRAYVNFFCALNFLQLDSAKEAAVEARQTDIFFRTLNTTSRARSFYNDDPFLRYFMGIVYENAGFINDAYISYKIALAGYKSKKIVAFPADLPVSLARAMKKLGLYGEIEKLKKEYAVEESFPRGSEIIIVCYNGLLPKKTDSIISLSLGKAWVYVDMDNAGTADEADFVKAKNTAVSAFANDTITVALPKMKKVPNKIKSFTAAVGGKEFASVLVSDIGAIAEKSLAQDLPKIYAKTVARAAVKYVLRKATVNAVNNADKTAGAIMDTVLNVFNTVSETADTRGWNSLPETILMARLPAAAGAQEITVSFNAANGNTVETKKVKVDVKKGGKTFIILRSFA